MEAIILNKKFQGPFNSVDMLKNRAGVYLVVCESFGMTPLRVLYSGETINIKETMRSPKKQSILSESAESKMKFLVYYENSESERVKLNKKIKKEFHRAL